MEKEQRDPKLLANVSIITSILALAAATTTGVFQYLSSAQANKISTQIESIRKRDEKAIEFTKLILSENEQERLEGLLKLSIIYRNSPEIEKKIIRRVNELREIDKKNYFGKAFSKSLSNQLALPVLTENNTGINKALIIALDVPDIMFASVYRENADLLKYLTKDKSNAEKHRKLSSEILNGVMSEFEEKVISQDVFFTKQKDGILFFLSSIVFNTYESDDDDWFFDKDKKKYADKDKQSYDVIGYLVMGIKI
jgi:hypothetical protein